MYLTPKQSGTAACLLDGLRPAQAAEALGISVKAYSRRVLRLRIEYRAQNTAQLIKKLASD